MSLSVASWQVALVDLPHAALYAILHRAGPRSRELCSALLDVYGPLPRLTPRGLKSPDELISALVTSGRHSRLSSLDLSHVPNAVVTDDSLRALCDALPDLRTLRLPNTLNKCRLTIACIAAATSQLPHLTALDVYNTSEMHNKSAEWPITAGFAHLKCLTLPTPLVAKSNASLFWLTGLTGLSKLCFNTYLEGSGIDVSQVASLGAWLPALVALELGGDFGLAVAQLRSLTRLTALTLKGELPEQGATAGQLLQHVGCLSNLRSLGLEPLWWPEGDTEVPRWLAQLSSLTSLRVWFGLPTDAETDWSHWPGFDEVASSVPGLPALCQLHLREMSDEGTQLSAAACAHIAAAHSSLRLLHLWGLSLPASMFTEVLPQLTALTSLQLMMSNGPVITSFSWLTVMTALRELQYDGDAEADAVLPCQLLAGLSHVDALCLSSCAFVDGPYVEQLCTSMPQLTSLDLRCNTNMGAGLSALQRLTNLEVLGLSNATSLPGTPPVLLMEHVRAPSSLRRCYLGHVWPHKQRAIARAALGRQVDAVFSHWWEHL